jgi:glycosyltransferase involved in cell wall biosynthesis
MIKATIRETMKSAAAKGCSIIIPVYNMEEWLERCIKSVVSQTYNELEIILVDDGSTDGSSDICKEWAKKDSRIVYFKQHNAGLGAARNTGLKMAKFDYVTFLDSDDWLEPTFVEKIFGAMLAADTQIGMCDICYVESETMQKQTAKVRFENSIVSSDQNKDIINKARLFAWGKIYKKSLFIGHSLWYPNFTFEDIITPIVIALADKIAYVSEPLICYFRNRKESLCNDPKNINDMAKGLKLLFDKFNELGMYEEYRLEFKKICLGQLRFACRKWGQHTDIQSIENTAAEYFPELKDISKRKYYLPTNSILRSALDKSLPFASQLVDSPSQANSVLPLDEESVVFNIAEYIMEDL